MAIYIGGQRSYTSGHRSGGATSIRNGIRSDCVSLRLMGHAAQDSKIVRRIDTYAMIEGRTTQAPKSRAPPTAQRAQGRLWGTRSAGTTASHENLEQFY